jgi:hypothetical protein
VNNLHGRCTNCGRYSDQCTGRGPGYLACPRCASVRREAVSGRVCGVCRRDDRRTVIYHGVVVCPFCLPDKDLMYLFMSDTRTPSATQDDNLWGIGLVVIGLVLLLLFWLVVVYG